MRSIRSRIERLEQATHIGSKQCFMIFIEGGQEVSKHPIPGDKDIVFIDDILDDDSDKELVLSHEHRTTIKEN